jgi:hypothetical protein
LVGLLVSSKSRDSLLGDLNERFTEELAQFGLMRARRLYWARALSSLWPLLRPAMKKIRLLAMWEIGRKIIGL